MADSRPVYLNLLRIRLPVTGVVSFAHRVTGVLLFLSLPFCIWTLEQSLASAAGFERVQDLFATSLLLRLLAVLVFWSLVHHLFAGIRFLLLDFDIGVHKAGSRAGAWAVLIAEAVLLLALLGMLL